MDILFDIPTAVVTLLTSVVRFCRITRIVRQDMIIRTKKFQEILLIISWRIIRIIRIVRTNLHWLLPTSVVLNLRLYIVAGALVAEDIILL